MWTTKEIPDYAEIIKFKSRYTSNDDISTALRTKDAEGFPVRMIMHEKERNMQMDLVKAQKTTVDDKLFSLDGYTKSAGPMGMPGGLDMSKLKDMTPEERQKVMEQMKKQYGGGK